MIAVIINQDGSLKSSTTRWNHLHGGSDRALTTKEISNLIGLNFYNIFKPNKLYKTIDEFYLKTY